MCEVINTQFILANLLLQSRRQASIPRLKKLRRKIENRIPSVFVDITMNSLCATVERHPDMFRWVAEDTIARAPSADKFFSKRYVKESINWRVPARLRRECLAAVAECVS